MRFSDSDSIGGGISRNGDAIPGKLGINTSAVPTNNYLVVNTPNTDDTLAEVQFTASSATRKGLVVQANASQTANIFEVQTSTGSLLFSISSGGTVAFSSNLVGTIETANFRPERQSSSAATFTANVNSGPIIACTGTATTAQTVTLSSGGGSPYPNLCVVKDEGGLAGTNNITIACASGGSIDGVTNGTVVISTNYGSVWIYGGLGANQWFTVGKL